MRPRTTNAPDCGIVYTLAAMLRNQAAADRALRLGPELLPAGPARAVAAFVLTGDDAPIRALTGDDRREADELGAAVVRCTVPGDDAEWAWHLVGLLAERRHLPLLASTLRWAADRVEDRVPLRHVRRCVEGAFRIAEGGDDAASAELLGAGSRGLGVAA